MAQFTGKVALVTGGTSGIGEAAAREFARAGAQVVVAGRRTEEGERVVTGIREAGGEAVFVRTDVSRADDNERLVQATLETYGRLDAAFNNAGTAAFSPLHETEEEEWDRQTDTNLKAAFFALKTQVPAMLRGGGGAIVFNATVVAEVGMAGAAVYAAGKGGVVSLARAAALEYATQGVRINVVNPGPIWTPMAEGGFGSQEAALGFFGPKIPMGRLGAPEEVAHAVLFLASDDAAFITGQALNVDGGYTAQ